MLTAKGASELQLEIEKALNKIGIENTNVRECANIVSEISSIYVDGQPRVWSLALKHIKFSRHFSDNSGYKAVSCCVKSLKQDKYSDGEIVFLIADDDGDFLVYRVPLNEIADIIGGCRYFECYVVACDYSWLICENDHDDVIVCQI